MADIDDFEIINETSLSNEQTFELIDVNGVAERNVNISTPTTPDVVLPFLIPTSLVKETSPIVQQQQTSNPIVNTPETIESHSSVTTTISTVPVVPIKRTVLPPPPPPPSPRTFAPVPPLPKAPPPRRYGDAALIPHNLDTSLDIDTVLEKSRKNQQTTLNVSTQQQQLQDIQTVLEQHRKLLNKK